MTKAQEVAPDVPEVLSKAIQDAVNEANKSAVSNAARVSNYTNKNVARDIACVVSFIVLICRT